MADISDRELARRRIYQAMIEQATSPEQQQVVSGRVVPYSPIQGLTKMAQAYMGRKGLEREDERARQEEEALRSRRTDATQQVIDTFKGREAVPYQLSEEERFGDEQIPGLYEKGAVQADPERAALMAALNPDLQGTGISNVVTALLNQKKKNGQYQVLTPQQAQQAGLPEGPTWGMSPEGKPEKLYDPKPEKDPFDKFYEKQMAIEQAKTQAAKDRASIPGTKEYTADQKIKTAEKKLESQQKFALGVYDNALSKIDTLLDDKNKGAFNNLYGGYNAYITEKFSGKTADLKTDRDALAQLLKVEGLKLVRQDGSPGTITEKEWPIFRDLIESIQEPTITEDTARKRLGELRKMFQDKVNELQGIEVDEDQTGTDEAPAVGSSTEDFMKSLDAELGF